jgi:hypothetical protein
MEQPMSRKMHTGKMLPALLAAAVLNYTLAPRLWADGERATRAEEQRYALREAQAPGLERFVGGCPGPDGWTLLLVFTIGLPVVIVVFLGYLVVDGVKLCFPSKEEPPREPEEKPGPDPKPLRNARPLSDGPVTRP